MVTNDQVKALVKSHGAGDSEHFYSVAMQVAARSARAGHSKFAQDLRDLVNELRDREPQPARGRGSSVRAIAQPRGELSGLLNVSYPDARLNDLVLADGLAARVKDVLTQQRQRERLAEFDLTPARRLLLVGPPGTGKTTTAKVLAAELGLPLFAVRLDTVLTKFMGETAAKLRLIFDALAETTGVYLFDEVDALGGDRAASNDVGEIRRVLNSFLQFLEEDTSQSVIVAATNHPQLLDPALQRRFDTVLGFGLPDKKAASRVIRNRLVRFQTSHLSWGRIEAAAKGLSHAEIGVAVDNAAKRAVLDGRLKILTADVLDALSERSCQREPEASNLRED